MLKHLGNNPFENEQREEREKYLDPFFKKSEKLFTLHPQISQTEDVVQQTIKKKTLQNFESEGWRYKKFTCNVCFPNGENATNCSFTIPEIESCRANGIQVIVNPGQ